MLGTKKMKIHIRSRGEVESGNLIDEPHVIVSISTPGDNFAAIKTNDHTQSIIRLRFDDLDQDHGEAARKYFGRDVVLFERLNAEHIAAFVKGHENIICHCDAGVSRSAAVGAALSKHYNGDDFWFFKHKCPNRLVYRIMLETLHDLEAKDD